jgi:plasmid stability protein
LIWVEEGREGRRWEADPIDIIGITAGKGASPATPCRTQALRGDPMADIVLRGLDEPLKEKLRQRAARSGRSMNAELREIVREALTRPRRADRAELARLAAEIRALSQGRAQTPAEELLREVREDREAADRPS